MKYSILLLMNILTAYSIFAQSSTIAGSTQIYNTDQTFNNVVANGNEDLDDGCLNNSLRTWVKFETNSSGTITITATPAQGWGGFLYPSTKGMSASVYSDLDRSSCNYGTSLSVDANKSYYLAIHRDDTTPFTLRIQSDNPLPVELSSFTCYIKKDVVFLNWKTATEVNNYGFEVERASFHNNETSPFQEWETIGFVEGSGNSNSPKDYSFVDENLPSNIQQTDKLEYRLKQIDTDGSYKYYSTTTEADLSSITSIRSTNLPTEFSLEQNYPNPFNPSTNINYNLAAPSFVQLNVFDLQGRKIALLVNEFQSSGNYKINYRAKSLSSGIYFYRLNAMDENKNILFSDFKKMLLIK